MWLKAYTLLAAAYVRSCMAEQNGSVPSEWLHTPLEQLTPQQCRAIMDYGIQQGWKLHHFKEKEELPRVRMAEGFLRAVYPQSLLDVGSGRGAFLFPFLRDFPHTPVTSLDILPHRVAFLQRLHDGGIHRLTAIQEDICTWQAPDNSFDVVTLLEVLEHIPAVEQAVLNAVRLAERYIVVSVPSKPDNNPEHIHLLTKEKLTALFGAVGVTKLHFDGVNGHLFMTASKG